MFRLGGGRGRGEEIPGLGVLGWVGLEGGREEGEGGGDGSPSRLGIGIGRSMKVGMEMWSLCPCSDTKSGQNEHMNA